MESGSNGLNEALKPYNEQLLDAAYGTRKSPIVHGSVRTPAQVQEELRGEDKLPFGSNRLGELTDPEKRQSLMLTRSITWMLQNNNITSSQPAHNAPPYWSDPVEQSARVSIPAAVSPVYTQVLSYLVPKGRRFSLKGIGVNVDDPAYTYDGGLTWRLTIDNSPVNTYDNFSEQRGSIVFPRRMPDTIVEYNQKLIFSVRRNVAATGAQDVEMMFHGYIWRLINTFEGSKGARPYA